MFRNQYDHDVSIWSPQGRIHQIEYAMEAVKQGSAAIALKNQDYAIIVALKRAPSELSSYQEKIIHVDDHIGVAISGLTADGRWLSRSMRKECADNRWAFDEPLPVSRLLQKISLKMQIPTQRYGRRPFGVGILVTGYDALGPHVYYLCPSSNAYDCKCIAIGSRSQSARTYLERHLDEFSSSSLDELICHGLKALNGTLPNEVTLTNKAYVTSTQFCNWYFSLSDLANLRSECNLAARKRLEVPADTGKDDPDMEETRYGGLDMDQELTIIQRYIYLMKMLFDKFTNPRLPDEVYGFAVTYFKRFYLNHSVMNFYPRDMMLTCLYVACKAADYPIGLQTFVSHIPRNQDRYSYFIINSELFLMEALGYDLWVFTPYRPLIGFIVDLVAYQRRIKQSNPNSEQSYIMDSKEADSRLITELRQEGTDLINLWYQTDLCLTTHPSHFALAVLVELGHTRPHLDVEGFVRDELCGCDPIQKSKDLMKKQDSDDDDDDDDDDDELDDDLKRKHKNQSDPSGYKNAPSPDERWNKLSERLDFIRQMINEFRFVAELDPVSPEEMLLDECRNPLYNLDSEEYAEAKAQADSLIQMLE